MSEITNQDKEIMGKLSGKELTEQEVFEAKQDLLGAFGWLLEMDKKYNPHLYESNWFTWKIKEAIAAFAYHLQPIDFLIRL